jgi:hypothetical protein
MRAALHRVHELGERNRVLHSLRIPGSIFLRASGDGLAGAEAFAGTGGTHVNADTLPIED